MPTLRAMLLLPDRYRPVVLMIAIGLYLAILVLGSLPGARAQLGEVAPGGVLHALAYGGLAWLVFNGVSGSAGRKAMMSVLAIAAMGALDEYVQHFFPYRGAAVGDWLVDIGAAAVMASLLFAASAGVCAGQQSVEQERRKRSLHVHDPGAMDGKE